MKATEWVARFNPDKQEEFLKAYAEETANLIADRTKGSGVYQSGEKKVDTRPTAIDGALREQRQKWQAICFKTSGSLTTEMFDTQVVGLHLPDVALAQQKWRENKNKPVEDQETAKPEEVAAGNVGRKLVKA
jgi:hypothetical protein